MQQGHAQTGQVDSALDALLSKHAYGAELSPAIVANVLRGTSTSASMCMSGVTLVFPECGSGSTNRSLH
jgi:hypothetical protein